MAGTTMPKSQHSHFEVRGIQVLLSAGFVLLAATLAVSAQLGSRPVLAAVEQQQEAHPQSTITYAGTPPRYTDPGDLKPLSFKLGKTYFEPGDAIVIEELRGTGQSSSGETLYQIKGHYTLASQDSALLAASVTTSSASRGGGGGGSMNMTVDKGDGRFTLWLWKHGEGSPHLSFYPAGGGNSFAGVYFIADPTAAIVASPVLGAGQTREVPKGWQLTGTAPDKYVTGIDKQVTHDGLSSAFLVSTSSSEGKFGTLMQYFKATDYLGKRVRLRARVKAQDVSSWAGLWMRVDENDKSVGFDNMQDRAIKGTTDWKLYDVVLDVPKRASTISMGILMDGTGEVWMSGVKLEAVGQEVALTDLQQGNSFPDKPVNLDFAK